jgi:4'-phosphopantetheinyl transferase
MRPGIGDGEVHVWVVQLRGAAGADLVLSPWERKRMDRFVSAADRHSYGLAHTSRRLILAMYLDCSPEQIDIRPDELGKPSVVGTKLEHSLAHADDRGLVAVGWGRSVGVDLERVRRIPDAEALTRSAFTPRERDHLDRAGDKVGELLRLWTRKEALLKATGEGVRETTRELDVLDDQPRAGWRLVDLELGSDYVGTVAVDWSVRCIRRLDWQKKSRPAGDGPARASGEEVLL